MVYSVLSVRWVSPSNFVKNIFNPAVEEAEDVSEDFNQLKRIDFNGMLFNIYLNELMKAASTIAGEIPDPCLTAESAELLRFLYRIASRGPEDFIDLNYKGVYFKIGIILAANDETLSQSGWASHFHYAKKLLDKGYDTLYIFGIGRKMKTATKIAYAVKDADDRIVRTVTHQYRHVNSETGWRTTAVCVELDTY